MTIMWKTNKNKKHSAGANSAMVIESLEGREMFAVDAFVWLNPPTTTVQSSLSQPVVKTTAVCPSDPSAKLVSTTIFKAEPPAAP
jgi:hypothetical protein